MKNTLNRGLSPLVIILLVAALLAISARLLYFKDKVEEPEVTNTSSQEQAGEVASESEGVTSTTTSVKTTTTKKQPTQQQATSGWETYRNDYYGFEVKYPSSWQAPKTTSNTTLGLKFEYKISFRESAAATSKGFDVKVYKTKLNVFRIETQTDDLSMVTSFDPRDTYASSCGFFAKDSMSIVYVPSNDKCFKEAYFYDIYKNNLIYTIIPIPTGGIGYTGYDGLAKTKVDLPEFANIVASFILTK